MADFPVNLIDIGVAAVLLLSALLAFSRGFVRESLAVAGWVGAGFAALYLYAPLSPFVRDYVPITIVAYAITVVGVFILTLIVISILSHRIAVRVRDSAIGALDRSLGFVFGLARGGAIVIVAYMLLSWLIPATDHPQIIRDARVTPWVKRGADILIKLVPETSQAREQVESALKKAGALNAATGGQLERALKQTLEDSKDKSGYNARQRSQMEQLIRSRQDK
jgi:membrane protein required for colicin V production